MGHDFCGHHGGMLRSRAQAEAPVYPKLSEVFGGSRSGESLDTSRMDETLKRLRDIARRGGSLIASVDPGSPEGDSSHTTEGPVIRIDELGSRNSDRQTWATQTPDGHTIYFQGRQEPTEEYDRIATTLLTFNEELVVRLRNGVTIEDGMRSPQLLLQEQCRSCRYRNHDFDEMVEREHLKDLKCGVNPSYAENGVGECGNFELEGDRPA